MFKKLISILAVMLVIAIVFSAGLSQVLAVSINGSLATIVYIDGIKFVITDTEDKIIVETQGQENDFKMYFWDNGKAYTESEGTNVWLNINELTDEKIDIDLETEDGAITKITDLEQDEYQGQALGTITLGGITLGKAILCAIAALLMTSAIYYISGEAYQALDYALNKKKISHNTYYKAYIYKKVVLVSKKGISKNSAINHIRLGWDVYSYKSSDARRIVEAVGKGVIGPEIDKKTTTSGIIKHGIYYYHYHTGNRNGAHSFYGNAYIY